MVNTQALVNTVFAYSTEQDKSFAITDGLSEVTEPVFDKGGKYLYLFGSTDAGPVQDWFAQSNADMRRQRNVYLVVLRKGIVVAAGEGERRGEAEEGRRAGGQTGRKDRRHARRRRREEGRCREEGALLD